VNAILKWIQRTSTWSFNRVGKWKTPIADSPKIDEGVKSGERSRKADFTLKGEPESRGEGGKIGGMIWTAGAEGTAEVVMNGEKVKSEGKRKIEGLIEDWTAPASIQRAPKKLEACSFHVYPRSEARGSFAKVIPGEPVFSLRQTW
jgi:hypothetical protein